jgi:hypothetical protein
MKAWEFLLLIIIIPIMVILCILISPFVLAFVIIAAICFIIALPTLLVFGAIYLVYKYGVKGRESKVPLVLFVIVIIILSPVLLILMFLLIPFGIILLICLYIVYGDGETAGRSHSRSRSSGFNSGFTMAMGANAIASAF